MLAAAVQERLARHVRHSIGLGRPPVSISTDPNQAFLPPGGMARLVHADLACMLVGGITALLLQTLHPLAMAGVAQHSRYRDDPLGRLRRTAAFISATSFGTKAEAERAFDAVRRAHRTVEGRAPDGRRYSAGDPPLVTFVHLAESWSFLEAWRRFGPRDLSAQECDRYYAEVAPIAEALGAIRVPRSVAEVEQYFTAVRPELGAGPSALEACHWLRRGIGRRPDERAVYAVLFAAAVSTLPDWARHELGLTWLPCPGGGSASLDLLVDTVAVIPATRLVTTGLRWIARPPVSGVSAPSERSRSAPDRP